MWRIRAGRDMSIDASDPDENALACRNVALGKGTKLQQHVVLGVPPDGVREGEIPTVLGADCLLRSHCVMYAGTHVGDRFRTGHHVTVREFCRIGDDVSIGTGTIVEHHVQIGHRVRIHSGAFVCEYTTLEEGCWLGPGVVTTNVLHPLCPKAKACLKGPTVRRGAKIGANVTLLPGVEIGRNALVGAGSVVTKNVAAGEVVAGNPASVIKDVRDLRCPFRLVDTPYPDKQR